MLDAGYFQTFNRDNVTLVDLRKDAVVEVTPTGIRTEHGFVELDVLVLATGFDAMTGALTRIDVRGEGDHLMRDDWADGPLALEYSMGSDWDDRWRTGGTLAEVMDEAHLTAPYLLAGIERVVRERESRLRRVREALEAAESRGAG